MVTMFFFSSDMINEKSNKISTQQYPMSVISDESV